jgi:hypothetical protein
MNLAPQFGDGIHLLRCPRCCNAWFESLQPFADLEQLRLTKLRQPLQRVWFGQLFDAAAARTSTPLGSLAGPSFLLAITGLLADQSEGRAEGATLRRPVRAGFRASSRDMDPCFGGG